MTISIENVSVNDKRVLVRVDFNVPIEKGEIQSDQRIQAALPTLKHLLKQGVSRLTLMSHLGRPNGEPNPKYSMDLVAKHLESILGMDVLLLNNPASEEAFQTFQANPSKVVLLENTRFYPGETKNDPELAKAFSRYGDIFVNDAFGAAHRAHASTAGVASFLPAYAGLLMSKELKALAHILEHPKSPFVAIIGGAKVSSKLGVITHLIEKVDAIVIGGAMAFTFLAAQGNPVGKSLVEPDLYETALDLIDQAKKADTRLVLPVDTVFAHSKDDETSVYTLDIHDHDKVIDDLSGVDMGPKSIELVTSLLNEAQTVLWNGPMGVFENPAFSTGTREVAKIVAAIDARGGTTVVGGGDSVAAIEQLNLMDKFTHVSTGGGASLEFLEGKDLPGVAALKQEGES